MVQLYGVITYLIVKSSVRREEWANLAAIRYNKSGFCTGHRNIEQASVLYPSVFVAEGRYGFGVREPLTTAEWQNDHIEFKPLC